MVQAEIVHQNNSRSLQSRHTAFGTGTIVLSAEKRGELWVAKQKIGKTETGRKTDVIDIFTETAVFEADGTIENAENNRLASLGEMINNTDLKEKRKNFHLVHEENTFRQSDSTPGVFYRSAILVYDGSPTDRFTPSAMGEVEPSFLIPLDQVKGDKVRPLAEEIVQRALDEGLIDEAYSKYDAGMFVPAFPEEFLDMEAFYDLRETKPDYIIYESHFMETKEAA